MLRGSVLRIVCFPFSVHFLDDSSSEMAAYKDVDLVAFFWAQKGFTKRCESAEDCF